MKKRRKIRKGLKISGKRLGLIFIVLGIVFLLEILMFFGSKIALFKILSFPLAISGILFIVFLCLIPQTLSSKNKIELTIIFISAILIFTGFLANALIIHDTIKRENDVIFIQDLECPELISANTDFNFFVFNSNLRAGTGIKIEFVGKGICVKEGEVCEEKKVLFPPNFSSAFGFSLLHAGQKQDFNISLNRMANKSNFYINFYDSATIRIQKPFECEYDENGLLIPQKLNSLELIRNKVESLIP